MGDKATSKQFAKQGVDDLVMLPKVVEDQIIENLYKRYTNQLIYTNIGPVLISVNPFKYLPITGPDYVQMYQGKFRHELPPHIFALAEETYRAMKNEGENQCVIISGESGAGKTEAAKLIMQFVAAVSGNSEGVEFVKHVILESNPLLEAFGNAKTLRNNNSSRFGKYFEIMFNHNGDPAGGQITNYLLEKSRVIFQTQGERNFHIFYDLLAGASDSEAQSWQLYSPENFCYLNQSGCYTVDNVDDAKEYGDVRHAMTVIEIAAQDQTDCLQIVSAILHIGNLAFQEDGKGNAQIYDQAVLDLASNMLQVDSFALQSAILFRVVTTGGAPGGRSSTYNVPQNYDQALNARDALAKVLYSRMFDWLVGQVNIALEKKKQPQKAVIGVLDIFGFEIFQKNGFEQFCINFVNEKLQQFFIELTLKAEQEEYVREGIKWEPVKYFNNQIVCDLIEGKAPPGIFSILDDICYTVHAQSGAAGVDSKFLGKLSGAFPSHLHLRCFDATFAVKHYAGEVTYDIDGFTDKNKDTLFNDIIETIQISNNRLVAALFPDDTRQQQKKRPTTAGLKIKTSAGQLMTTLAACTPHYIRCIKPNETKIAFDWDQARVKHQVQYLGLLENVRVRRAGFAYRAEFARFLSRYKKLSRKTWGIWGEWSGDAKDGCSVLLTDLGLDSKQWQLGKTKVFIRHPESLFFLEELLERRDYDMTVRIQTAWQNWKRKKISLEQKARAADLLRGKKERQQASLGRKFAGDYEHYKHNNDLQEAVNSGETVVFADQVVVINRRGQAERRDFIITDKNFYFVMRKKKDGKFSYEVSRRSPLTSIQSISLSSLQDNFIVITCPSEYDMCFQNEHKTEIAVLLINNCKNTTGRDIPLQISDNITFTIKTKDTRTLSAQKNEGSSTAQLKKSGKTLQVFVSSGLPKDTDTTPKNFGKGGYQIATRVAPGPGGGGGRGGAGGARGGGGGRGGAAPAQASAPAGARGGAGPRGGGAPSGGGGAVRGGPGAGPAATGGGGGSQRGGPAAGGGAARGGPSGGGAGGGGAARGGPGAGGAAAAVAAGAASRGGAAGGAARGGPGPARGGAAKAPPAKSSVPQAKALYDYDAGTEDELSFREGDILQIHQKDPGGWWEGEINGKRGWIPANYVQEC